MARRRLLILLILFLCLASLAVASFWLDNHYLLISFVLVLLSILPFFLRFEYKKIDAKEIVLIAMLSAIAAVSRIPFAPLPNIKPVTFIVIVSALVFGAEAGFIIGSTAALVSNIFFGQGPWTPWQMFAWGMAGFVTGLFKDAKWLSRPLGRAVYGFIWGFLFDWFMNLSIVVGYINDFSWKTFLATYIASFYFDLLHGGSNAIFLYVFGASWIKMLERFKRKYGLLC
ncbi:ECF transporter S component [Fodinisporobacter ferrooxydans]|uniref:ECF transporter S component n=1 Tax=Fodinisporobacter ferrooxydans TaxID=2901836 RepID=A0ABY4CQ31_9BACL|nr:ECF transporter S component [Alicyclobacillaceae bacterium MYW30-H2]